MPCHCDNSAYRPAVVRFREIMSKYYITSGVAIEELVIGEKLGASDAGNVFAIIAPLQLADSAAKIYLNPKAFDAERIGTLVEKVPSQLWAVLASGAQYPQYAWPQHIVYAKSAFAKGLQPVGILMPKIDSLATVTLDAYFDPSSGKTMGLDAHRLALPRKVAIAINLCKLLGELHSRKVYCIDFKPENILANRNGGQVTLLDCDNYAVISNNGNYYPATHLSTGYVAPEALKGKGVAADLAEAQDCFALAAGLFRLFNYGISPFSGTINKSWREAEGDDARVEAGYYPYGLHPNPAIVPSPQSVHDCLPVSLRQMFDRAFREGKGRPTAQEWEDVLRGLREKAKYVTCKEHPNDPEHIHFGGLPCCRCERDKRIGTTEVGSANPVPSRINVDIQSPNSQNAAHSTPEAHLSKTASGWRHWIIWIVAVALGITLLTFLGNRDGDNSSTHVRTPLQSPPLSQTPGESTRSEPVASIKPAMPQAESPGRRPFTKEEIYYCLEKEYRLNVISNILSGSNTPAPVTLLSDSSDYNARCKNYAFSGSDHEAAKSTFERNKESIRDKALTEAESFKKIALPSSPTTDEAGDQGLLPNKASDSGAQKQSGARPLQHDQAKTRGAPVASLQHEKPADSRVSPTMPGGENSTGIDSPNRGHATRTQEPVQVRNDSAPNLAPRQQKPLSSSLLTAIQRGDLPTVNEYLNRGTSPNEIMANGAPILKNAVVSSAMPVAELLLSRGADVNARDASGKTALYWAKRMNNEAFVQMLLKHGAQD